MTDGPKRIFTPKAIALHRARAAHMAGERFLWREAAGGLSDRLYPLARHFTHALAVEAMAADALGPNAESWTVAGFDAEERLTAEGRFALAVSLLSLHDIDDLPGALAQIRRHLTADGFFAAALFAEGTLAELKESLTAGECETAGGAALRVAPFADIRDLGRLMIRAGFVAPVAEIERTTVQYREISTLVRDLRLMGETGILADCHPLSRAALAAALAHYATHYADAEGRLTATFDIAYLTGWTEPQRNG
jgi:SAM-dependent methyltransferase